MAFVLLGIAWCLNIFPVFVSDPILPDLLHQIDLHPNRIVGCSFLTHPDLINSGNSTTTDPQSKNSMKIAVLVGMKPLLEVFFNVIVGFILERLDSMLSHLMYFQSFLFELVMLLQ